MIGPLGGVRVIDALPLVCAPYVYGSEPLPFRLAPPLLGEHTDQVLAENVGL